LPDMRNKTESNMVQLAMAVVVIGMCVVHGAWFALRYA
jgi:hypothetical protein